MRIFETKDYLNLMEDSYVKNNLCNQNGYPIEIIGVIEAPYPIIAKIKNPNTKSGEDISYFKKQTIEEFFNIKEKENDE